MLVLLVTLAFGWLLTPYFSAILWGVVAAIVFGPLYRWLTRRLGGRKGLAATLTLLIILALVILPAILMTFSLIQEAVGLYTKLQSNKIDFSAIFNKLSHSMPRGVTRLARQYDLMDAERARELIRSALSAGLGSMATRALTVGQGALAFLAQLGVMLYLTYFLLRDGDSLGRRFSEALPLRPQTREHLIDNFVRVVRATMKGTVLVAVLQGIVGGVIFGKTSPAGRPVSATTSASALCSGPPSGRPERWRNSALPALRSAQASKARQKARSKPGATSGAPRKQLG
ncbi:MAG: AI-2E family transporter [Methylocystaceae bacterium]|nr:AI-2E family transporter [Methylocystaceae bacterium]